MQNAPRDPQRPPVPDWMKLLFIFGPVAGIPLLEGIFVSGRYKGEAVIIGLYLGILASLPSIGGLAAAAFYFNGVVARLFGGIVFTGLLLVMFWAVLYVGCKCAGF